MDGWYLGPALKSYRCYTVWINETQAQCICDTLTWLPTKIPMPSASSVNHILAGIVDIAHALKHPSPNSPLAPLADSQSTALRKIMELINSAAPTALAKTPRRQPVTIATATTPPLRVQAPIAIVTLTPDTQEAILIPPDDDNAAALRVEPTPPREPSPTIIPPDDDVTVPRNNRTHRTPPPPAQRSQPAQHPRRSPRNHAPHAAHFGQHTAHHGNAFDPNTGELAEYGVLSRSTDGALWQAANTTEIHRLAQGTTTTPGTNTMFFIPVTAIPHGKQATYLRIVCAHQPEKSIPHRVRWTVGGDRVQYDGDVSTKTADLATAKLLFNSVVSTPGAWCMIGDLKDLYLGTPMPTSDY